MYSNSNVCSPFYQIFADPPLVTLRLGSTLTPDDIKEGDDVYFECHVQSNPQWRKLLWLHNVGRIKSAGSELLSLCLPLPSPAYPFPLSSYTEPSPKLSDIGIRTQLGTGTGSSGPTQAGCLLGWLPFISV